MPDRADCPNCRRLLAEVRTLRRDLAAARNDLAAAKQRIQALEAELRRGNRWPSSPKVGQGDRVAPGVARERSW